MKVSICTITFNQEEYISYAIECALSQKTDFTYELVIGDDSSTDNTLKIIKNYQSKYPDKIRLLESKKNLGMQRNFIRTLRACRGKYVALLEGDDYWVSGKKLQIQADFLDKNPSYSFCFHKVKVCKEYSQKPLYFMPIKEFLKKNYEMKDLLVNNFIGTCSVMFRNRLFKNYPQWMNRLSIGDWPLHILNSSYGQIGYIDKTMSVYRIHSNSNFYNLSIQKKLHAYIKFYRAIDRHFHGKYNALISQMISHNYLLLAFEEFRSFRIKKASNLLFKGLSITHLNWFSFKFLVSKLIPKIVIRLE